MGGALEDRSRAHTPQAICTLLTITLLPGSTITGHFERRPAPGKKTGEYPDSDHSIRLYLAGDRLSA